jgi:hypothetical protein
MNKPVPSIKILSERLGKNPSTVSSAIKRTMAKFLEEGILVSKGGLTVPNAKVFDNTNIDDFCSNFLSNTRKRINNESKSLRN